MFNVITFRCPAEHDHRSTDLRNRGLVHVVLPVPGELGSIAFQMTGGGLEWLIVLRVSRKGFAGLKCKLLFLKDLKIAVCCPVE